MTRHAETLALHGGSFRADPVTGAVAPPIYQTTSYVFPSTEHARKLFYLEEIGYTYTRTSSPGREVLERRFAALEGGAAALAVASGAAALLYAVLNLTEAGDNIVVPPSLAQGRHAGVLTTLARLGIEIRTASPFESAGSVDSRTRAFVAESLSLPGLDPFPIADVAGIGRRLGVPLIVENSLLPSWRHPLELGAAIVTYSAAGYLAGHATTDGGLIVDGNTFPWETHADRFPALNRPDPSYHGAVWVEVVKRWNAAPFIARTRARSLRDFGAAISPFDVFQILQGIETLPLRLRHHRSNAETVAETLSRHGKPAGPVERQGGLLALRLRDEASAERFRAGLKLALLTGSPGISRTTLVEPSGSAGRILLSIGLEHPDDIVADLTRALEQA